MATLTPEILLQLRTEMATMIQQGILAAQQSAPVAAASQQGTNPFSEDENGGMSGDMGSRRTGGGSSSYLFAKTPVLNRSVVTLPPGTFGASASRDWCVVRTKRFTRE